MWLFLQVSVVAGTSLCAAAATACPFCAGPARTWSEIVADSDHVVMAELVNLQVRQDGCLGQFRVVGSLPHKTRFDSPVIVASCYEAAAVGTAFILCGTARSPDNVSIKTFAADLNGKSGTQPGPVIAPRLSTGDRETTDVRLAAASTDATAGVINIDWDDPVQIDTATWDYLLKAPGLDVESADRLRYFVDHLQSDQEMIANDAFSEFASADYVAIKAIRNDFSQARLRRWIADPQTTPDRLGVYGMMLGLCGTAEDAAFLRDQIGSPSQQFRFGIDGMMAGLLLLDEEAGLQFLSDTRLQSSDASVMEIKTAIAALNFMWTHERSVLGEESLRNGLRPLISHPDLGDAVIRDLARWQDWTLIPQLREIYESGTDRYMKEAIAGYLLAADHCARRNPEEISPDAAAVAGQLLQQMRQKDPRSVERAELF